MSKNKKKFKAGLESLFGSEKDEETLAEESPLLVQTHALVKKKKTKRIKKTSGKNFTSDLDSLFEDTVKETIKEQAQSLVEGSRAEKKQSKRRSKKPLIGLDALIQRTYDGVDDADFKKRVTVVLEKKKVERLKKIAKSEKKYLKDILGNLVTEFMKEYDKKERRRKDN